MLQCTVRAPHASHWQCLQSSAGRLTLLTARSLTLLTARSRDSEAAQIAHGRDQPMRGLFKAQSTEESSVLPPRPALPCVIA